MFFGTDEQKKDHIRKEIEAKKAMLPYFPVLKKVISSFDGKVFNCRLDKAIREATANEDHISIYAGTEYGDWIYIRGYSQCNGALTFFHMKKEDLKDGKRIDSGQWFDIINANYAETLKEIYALENDIANIDDILSKVEVLKKQIESLIDPLQWTTRDTYNISRITI